MTCLYEYVNESVRVRLSLNTKHAKQKPEDTEVYDNDDEGKGTSICLENQDTNFQVTEPISLLSLLIYLIIFIISPFNICINIFFISIYRLYW